MSDFKIIKTDKAYPYVYSMTEKEVFIEDNGIVKVYGIEISGDNEKGLVEDISCERKKVEELFDLSVKEGLCPVHLNDVAEDFMVSV